MVHTKASLDAILKERVAILGYGNQGRAHALCLRDSGVSVLVGSRPGKAFDQALQDGFQPIPIAEAASSASVVLFLFPDETTGKIYSDVQKHLDGKYVGFAHGFSYHFETFKRSPTVHYFLVGPKGAGAILREKYLSGEGLPGVYAVSDSNSKTEEIAKSYACAIGLTKKILLKTTFQEETECDLFGEQAVLCGGLIELIEKAFKTLVQNGHSKEMAFFETCYEAKLILDLLLKFGPATMTEKISPTAFYGGFTRGRMLITPETEKKMAEIFSLIRNGKFAQEWLSEVEKGRPSLFGRREELKQSSLEEAFQILKQYL